jgi:predicted kinase
MAGTTGSGKTTVSSILRAEDSSICHLESDVVRKTLAGVPPTARVGTRDLHAGIYSEQMTDATYDEMYRRARLELRSGRSVILDGSFRQRWRREQATRLAREQGCPCVVVECHVGHAEQLARLVARFRDPGAPSDGRPDVLTLHESDWEPVADSEADRVLRVDTAQPFESLAALIGSALIRTHGNIAFSGGGARSAP